MRSEISGVQEPRLSFVGESVDDFADEAAAFASAYGLSPDPWQKLVLKHWLGVREDGKWTASRCGLSVPRQNGKNALIEIRELFGIVGLGEKILHTAHEMKTARKAFMRLSGFFTNKNAYPELAELVQEIRRTNGQEAIFLTNGGSVEFVARSKGSSRGFTVDVVVMDEAQEMSDDALEALGPTTAAAPLKNRQMIWTGTPPSPGMVSEVFTRLRTEALDGNGPRLCWDEWSADPHSDWDSPETWAVANPALGFRLSVEDVAEDRATYSDEGFGRERLGNWSVQASKAVIPHGVWAEFGDPSIVRDPDAPVVIGIDVNATQTRTTIVGATLCPLGNVILQVLESREGPSDWVVPQVAEKLRTYPKYAVVIDAYGTGAHLIEALRAKKVKVSSVSVGDVKAACAGFFDAVMSGHVRHLNEPVLTASVAAGRKRVVGDAWAWNKKDPSSDITPLVAATLAHYGLQAQKVKKLSGRTRDMRSAARRKVVSA